MNQDHNGNTHLSSIYFLGTCLSQLAPRDISINEGARIHFFTISKCQWSLSYIFRARYLVYSEGREQSPILPFSLPLFQSSLLFHLSFHDSASLFHSIASSRNKRFTFRPFSLSGSFQAPFRILRNLTLAASGWAMRKKIPSVLQEP